MVNYRRIADRRQYGGTGAKPCIKLEYRWHRRTMDVNILC